MATLEKAEGLLEELRGASYDAAVKDMEELKAFAAESVSLSGLAVHALSYNLAFPSHSLNQSGQVGSTAPR